MWAAQGRLVDAWPERPSFGTNKASARLMVPCVALFALCWAWHVSPTSNALMARRAAIDPPVQKVRLQTLAQRLTGGRASQRRDSSPARGAWETEMGQSRDGQWEKAKIKRLETN